VGHLAPDILVLLDLFLVLPLALDREHVAKHADVDILRLHPGQVGADHELPGADEAFERRGMAFEIDVLERRVLEHLAQLAGEGPVPSGEFAKRSPRQHGTHTKSPPWWFKRIIAPAFPACKRR